MNFLNTIVITTMVLLGFAQKSCPGSKMFRSQPDYSDESYGHDYERLCRFERCRNDTDCGRHHFCSNDFKNEREGHYHCKYNDSFKDDSLDMYSEKVCQRMVAEAKAVLLDQYNHNKTACEECACTKKKEVNRKLGAEPESFWLGFFFGVVVASIGWVVFILFRNPPKWFKRNWNYDVNDATESPLSSSS